MPFTDEEKTEIRRHCGCPLADQVADVVPDLRFYYACDLLEYRLLRLSGAEEDLVRRSLAAIAFMDATLPHEPRVIMTTIRERWLAIYQEWLRMTIGLPPVQVPHEEYPPQ